MTEYEAVLFDNDGVLVELTERSILREAAEHAFRDVGVETPEDSLLAAAVEGSLPELAAVEETHGVDLGEYWQARERRATEYQRRAIRGGGKPLYDDVRALWGLPVPLGVVSNNHQATVEYIVEHYDLTGLFDVVYGREPTVEGLRNVKPDPHYVERALADLDANDPLYVGDSPTDVTAAHRVGADAAFLRRPNRGTVTLDSKPEYRVADLAELVEILGGESGSRS